MNPLMSLTMNPLMNPLTEIGALLATVRRILLVSHVSPDGDTCGSALGLAWALRSRGIEARLACADALPADLHFLPGAADYAARTRTDEDAVFVLDTSDTARMGAVYDPVALAQVPLVNIDHHTTNLNYGSINYVVPAAATAELVYHLLAALEIDIDGRAATCLLAGIVSDTRGFRISSTSADSLRIAAALVDAGGSLAFVNDAVFNHRPVEILGVWGAALTAARIDDGILWTELRQAMVRSNGLDLAASSGLANFLSTLDAVRVVILFRELADGRVEISFRSIPGLDISSVALALGGGGHPQAAGCTLAGPLDAAREQVLTVVRASVQAQAGS